MCVYDEQELRNIVFGTSVFNDRSVLVPGYIPSTLTEVMHRNEIIHDYVMSIRSIVSNVVPTNLLLFGKSGTGKTMLTKLVISNIANMAKEVGISTNLIAIQCESTKTDLEVVKSVIDHFEPTHDTNGTRIKRRLTHSYNAYFNYMTQLLRKHESNEITIIFFDEVDKINNPNILNQFVRLKENGLTENNVCVICASNDSSFYKKLSYQTRNAFRKQMITFTPYTTSQLEDILRSRAEIAFKKDAITNDAIGLCAVLSAKYKGNARTAIELLILAGDLADRIESNTVTFELVNRADEENEEEHLSTIISTLPYHSKLLLFSHTNLTTRTKVDAPLLSDVIKLYNKICAEDGTKPLSNRRIYELIDELIILGVLIDETISRGKKGGIQKKLKSIYTPEKMRELISEKLKEEKL